MYNFNVKMFFKMCVPFYYLYSIYRRFDKTVEGKWIRFIFKCSTTLNVWLSNVVGMVWWDRGKVLHNRCIWMNIFTSFFKTLIFWAATWLRRSSVSVWDCLFSLSIISFAYNPSSSLSISCCTKKEKYNLLTAEIAVLLMESLLGS